MSASERKITALMEEVVNLRVMATEFDIFMKAVIMQHNINGVFVLSKEHVKGAYDAAKRIVKVEGDTNHIRYTICDPLPQNVIEIPKS
jgi:hypothetical protein